MTSPIERRMDDEAHLLVKGLGFWQAVAINVTQIVGAGVFATIPLIMGHLPGQYALLAWLVAGALILVDGMIWGELGAALPSAGGSYHFLLESYGRHKWGRLMAFLFVWQILISGPLEVGSGLVAAAQFSTWLSPEFREFNDAHTWTSGVTLPGGQALEIAFGPSRAIGFGLGLLILFLLYRRVTTLGRLSVIFMAGVLALLAWVLVEGAIHFDCALAFTSTGPPEDFAKKLGAGMSLAIYSYLGYYNVCYLGGEVRHPERTIPRAILTSALLVVVLFTLVHLAVAGVVPSGDAEQAKSNLTAEFMNRVHGPWAATLVSALLLGSCFASVFSGTLGYSRVPYAAAKERHFFGWFAEVHASHRIPHRSLLLIGGLMLFWSFFSLDAIIAALIATRILEQFVAQAFAVMLLRKAGRPLPWRMWLYPLPCLLALGGWMYVYLTFDLLYIGVGAATLIIGFVVFMLWAKQQQEWPYRP
jgi:amino acid transporter